MIMMGRSKGVLTFGDVERSARCLDLSQRNVYFPSLFTDDMFTALRKRGYIDFDVKMRASTMCTVHVNLSHIFTKFHRLSMESSLAIRRGDVQLCYSVANRAAL